MSILRSDQADSVIAKPNQRLLDANRVPFFFLHFGG
jgi:hypothetical protein